MKDIQINDILNNGGSVVDIRNDGYTYFVCTNNNTHQELKTRTPYVLCGSDYSAQEPRLTAYCSGDETMKQAYRDKKDLYAVIAQSMYKNKYEDNLEFYPEGTHITIDGEDIVCGYKTHKNKDGKKRRGAGKILQLGITYGMSPYTIATSLKEPKEAGQKIMDDFFNSFPKVKQWVESSKEKARKLGYVEDWYGRRRHLPDIQLPKYSLSYTQEYSKNHNTFNPILICNDRVEDTLINKYKKLLENVKGRRQLSSLTNDALKEGVVITSNDDKISKAERQCVNAIIQGGAATLTKMAMINIYNDKELNELGLKMLIPIHDEILCTCPKINEERASQRLVEVMVDTAKPYIDVPMQCDPYVVSNWYFDELSVQVQNEYDDLCDTYPKEQAFEKLKEIHCELLEGDIIKMLDNK